MVFFDIGNCLYDPYRTFQRTLAALGRPELADTILARFGVYPDQPGRHDPWLQQCGFSRAEIGEYFRRFFHEPVYHAGSPAILDRMRARGAHLGIISDGHFGTQVGKLRAWGLSDRFDPRVVFIGSSQDDLTRTPGDYPEGVQLPGTKRQLVTFHTISARARELYGVVPENCWMVGDDYVRDALHPMQTGWRGVWFVPNEPARRTRPPLGDPADTGEVVPTIDDLARLEGLVYPVSG
jgi:FMN phosphatase YigB (HAD superfamily)